MRQAKQTLSWHDLRCLSSSHVAGAEAYEQRPVASKCRAASVQIPPLPLSISCSKPESWGMGKAINL